MKDLHFDEVVFSHKMWTGGAGFISLIWLS